MSLAAKKFSERKPIGQVLVDRGQLTEADRDQVLKKAAKTQTRVGTLLVSDGYVTETQLAEGLAATFDLEYLDLAEVSPEPKALEKIPYSVAKQYNVLPLAFDGDHLVVTTYDPTNGPNLSKIKHLHHQLKLKVSPASQIKVAIEKSYAEGAAQRSLGDSGSRSQELPSMDRLIQDIFERALSLDASDIHIEPLSKSLRIRHRVHGILREAGQLPKEAHLPLISKLKVLSNLDVAEKRQSQDGGFQFSWAARGIDVRLSTLPTIQGEKAVLRILDKSVLKPHLEDLGMGTDLAAKMKFLITRPSGILLVTGPTGSGKTTTVYSLIELFNHTEKNLITIEDPVEYRLENINQVQVNARAGVTFPAALRSMLRQDPDVVIIGEIRDRETAEIAVRAALTGHIVISTLHTNDSVSSISRLMDMGIEPYLIASSLLGILSQRLVRILCPACRKLDAVPETLERLLGTKLPVSTQVGTPVGCPKCSGQGYRGRQAIFELLSPSAPVKEAITRRASESELMTLLRSEGFTNMREDGLKKAQQATTSLDEILKQTL